MDRPTEQDVSHLLVRHISPAAGGALYQQVIDAIKREISEGRLLPGQAMPSFRILARDLMVSIITVKRAYEELEREGILTLRQGLGTFVTDNGCDVTRRAKEAEARRLMADAVREGREAGLSEREILKMMKTIFSEGAEPGSAEPGVSGPSNRKPLTSARAPAGVGTTAERASSGGASSRSANHPIIGNRKTGREEKK